MRLWIFAVFLFGCALGALNIAANHVSHVWLACLLYTSVVALPMGWLAFHRFPACLIRLLGNGFILAMVLLLIGGFDVVHYVRESAGPHPSTSQLALQVPAQALLHGQNPYHPRLADGAPISPGPGWILVVLPLIVLHAGPAIGMVALIAAAFAVRTRGAENGGALCLLMLLQPHFDSQAAGGGDLYAISLLLGAWVVLIFRADRPPWQILLLGLAGGMLGTARMLLLPLMLVPCVALFRADRRKALSLAVSVTATTVLFDAGFAWWARAQQDVFQPLHIFRRGNADMGTALRAVALVSLLLAAIYVFRFMRGTPRDALIGTSSIMAALFVPVGFGELLRTGFDLRWEGCNYVLLPLPLLALWLVLTRNSPPA